MKAPIDMMLDGAEWRQVDNPNSGNNDLPYVTHEGCIELLGQRIKVVQLSTGERLFPEGEIDKLLPGWQEILEQIK